MQASWWIVVSPLDHERINLLGGFTMSARRPYGRSYVVSARHGVLLSSQLLLLMMIAKASISIYLIANITMIEATPTT